MDVLHDGRRLPTDDKPYDNRPFVMYQRRRETLRDDVTMMYRFAAKRLGRSPDTVIVNLDYPEDTFVPLGLKLERREGFTDGHFGLM